MNYKASLAGLRARKRGDRVLLTEEELLTLIETAEAAQELATWGLEVGDGRFEVRGGDMEKLEAALAKVGP